MPKSSHRSVPSWAPNESSRFSSQWRRERSTSWDSYRILAARDAISSWTDELPQPNFDSSRKSREHQDSASRLRFDRIGTNKELPEDFHIRGYLWGRLYYPGGFFTDMPDEEARHIEMPSFIITRARRSIWLGLCIAEVSSLRCPS